MPPKLTPEEEEKAKRDRYLYVLSLLVGQKAEAHVDGKPAPVDCTLHTATPFKDMEHKFVLKDVAGADGVPQTLVLGADKLGLLTFRNPRVVGDPRSSGFRTDGDIARPDKGLHGRRLEALDSSWLSAPRVKPPPRSTSGGKWDQFEANSALFGVKSEFDENVYTTKLDASAVTPEQVAEAERLAAEIEGAASSNIHIAEERGQKIDTDMDEEDRFSGVIRPSQLPPGLSPGGPKAPAPAPAPAPASKLSATAKEFKFNVGAAEFTPSFAPPPPPPPAPYPVYPGADGGVPYPGAPYGGFALDPYGNPMPYPPAGMPYGFQPQFMPPQMMPRGPVPYGGGYNPNYAGGGRGRGDYNGRGRGGRGRGRGRGGGGGGHDGSSSPGGAAGGAATPPPS